MSIEKAIKLIAKYEGCELEAYADAVGFPTIGYGNRFLLDGTEVELGMKISQEQADELLKESVVDLMTMIKDFVKVDASENQLCAACSLAFNIGINAFKRSTLLRYWNANADLDQVALEFLKWNKAGGEVLNGLVKRRNEEMLLFLS